MAEEWNKFIPVEATNAVDKYVKKITAGKGNIGNVQDIVSEISQASHNDDARNIFNKMAEHADKLPFGQDIFDKGNAAIEAIKKMDPSNSSGAVQPALDIMNKLLKNGGVDPLQAVKGLMGGDLYGIMGQVMALINKPGGGGGGNNGGITAGSPCTIEDPITHVISSGTMQMSNNAVLVCLPLPTANNGAPRNGR